MDESDSIRLQELHRMAGRLLQTDPPPPPLEKTPCAFAIPGRQWSCLKEATSFCSGCRLVAYCSKECQKNHWPTHKSDCKDKLRSKTWSPGWIVEGRQPTFMSNQETSPNQDATVYFNALAAEEPLSMGVHLWGNLPAMDLLNFQLNEGSESVRDSDLNIASVASGDLRHIILTVNSLPEDFQGTLNIVLNDREPTVVARNLALLLAFAGNTQLSTDSPADITNTAEMALHLWASVYVPAQYDRRLVFAITKFLGIVLGRSASLIIDDPAEIPIDIPLGDTSRLKGSLPRAVLGTLYSWGERQPHGIGVINQEITRVRYAPTRKDRHDRKYCGLEPSHRLSHEEFRRSGLTLPFGARNDLFNTPNRLLFTAQGRWLQDDLATPIESWKDGSIESVITAGKAHGSSREDLYGCLYFFLTDTFREFVARLRRFSITFELYCEDASKLSRRISTSLKTKPGASTNLPSPRQFDRIDVSNILDTNYCGIEGVLADWGPLLKPTKHSCILGYFMNWAMVQEGSNIQTASKNVLSKLVNQHVKEGKIPAVDKSASIAEIQRLSGLMMGYMTPMTTALENSAAFKEYLERHGLSKALKKTRMRWKLPHTVLPYRIGVPAEESNSITTLPLFNQDRERWYLNACMGGPMWSERFIEFCRDD